MRPAEAAADLSFTESQGGQQAQGGNDGAQDVQDADFEEVK